MVDVIQLNVMTGKCGCNIKFCWVMLLRELMEMEMVMKKKKIEGIVTEVVAE